MEILAREANQRRKTIINVLPVKEVKADAKEKQVTFLKNIEEINDIIMIDCDGNIIFLNSRLDTLDTEYLNKYKKDFKYILNLNNFQIFVWFYLFSRANN
jgi:hypothetical protein